MTNSTPTFWSVDGTSLQTFAWNIQTRGGDRMAPPPMRGDNDEVPHIEGLVWKPKIAGPRVMSLDMWVIGADADGTVQDEAAFDTNWNALRALLWNPRAQLAVTKRWEDSGVQSAVGYAQFTAGLNPTITGGRRAKFSVDLLMADPWFYGSPIVIPTLNAGNPSEAFTVIGDWHTNAIDVAITGPLTVPRLTKANGDWMEFNGPTLIGETTDIDVNSYEADTDGAKAAGYVSKSGGIRWLELSPGAETLTFSTQAGTGDVDVTYQPVWM